MAQSNCGRGGRMAPPGSNKRMGAKAVSVPRFCHHDTQGPPSIFLAQKTGTLAEFPIRHRGHAYLLAIISQTETCRSQCYQRFAFVDQLRGRRTSFKIVLDLRQEPLEPVRLGFVSE